MAIIGFVFLFIILAGLTFISVANLWVLIHLGRSRGDAIFFAISACSILLGWYMLFKHVPFAIVAG